MRKIFQVIIALLFLVVSVPNDNTANDTASAQTVLSIDHELSILITVVEPPGASVANSGAVTLYADLVNNNSVAETGIDVSLTDTPQGGLCPDPFKMT